MTEDRTLLGLGEADRSLSHHLTPTNQQDYGQDGEDNSRNHSIELPGNDYGNDDEDEEDFDNSVHHALQRLIMVAAATAATLGYDVGIMAAAIQPIEETMELNGVQKEVAMGSLNFVAALGALVGGKVANERGRKYTVKFCCWIFLVGTILMAGAPTYSFLLLGRIVTGIGVGVSFVVAPVYLAEVAPTHMRGKLNTIFDVAINGGILLGYIIGFVVQLLPNVSPQYKWRIMLLLGICAPLLVLYNLVHLPESPRWLVMVDQSAAAGQILAHLGSTPGQIRRTVSAIEEELQQEGQSPSGSPLDAILRCRFSSGMRLAMALGFWQQITGTESVLYYSADFLQHAGLETPSLRLAGNIFVGLCKLTPELIAMQWVDKVGRRPLILASAIALVLSTFLLSLAFFANFSPLLVVLFLCCIMASFSLGLGPFTFLVASESLSLTERATGMTLCATTNRLTSGAVALTAVSLYSSLGSGGLFAFYGTIGVFSLPFYYRAVPETTGQSLEELAARNREMELQGASNSSSPMGTFA